MSDTLISEEYRRMNEELHSSNQSYGCSGHKFAQFVRNFSDSYESRDILDYGCGKATLSAALGFNIVNYDPAIPAYNTRPEQHDLVVCTDVLEHIEPELVENVLEDIHSLARKAVFLTIANRPAKKVLPDGRNAHLIQEHYTWWLPRIWKLFNVTQFVNRGNKEYLVAGEPLRTNGTHN